MDRVKARLLVERIAAGAMLALVLLALLFFAGLAHAQAGGVVWSERSSSQPHGRYVWMWNSTGTQINAGTVVMIDTTSATVVPQIPVGKGFKTWDGNVGNYKRIVGLLMENVAGNLGGRVMVEGTYNYALMAATAYTGYTILEPSLTVSGALASHAAADSTLIYHKPCGLFGRYVNDVTTGSQALRGLVYVRFPDVSR